MDLETQDEQVHCWTDSMCVLYWIHNNRLWKQFVNHRVQEIHKLTDKHIWRHCPGVMNLADLPSRGMNASELTNSRLWWHGPAFLQLPREMWPIDELITSNDTINRER